MDKNLCLILLIFGCCIPFSSHLRHFVYVNQKMNWNDAQSYCREKYTDLATIQSDGQISRLNRPQLDTDIAWIGLSDVPNSWKSVTANDANSWKWSATGKGSTTNYQPWFVGDPNNIANENCVSMDGLGSWLDFNCNHLKYSVCHNETATDEKTYTFVGLLLTWSDAQSYCRTHFTDLATIENAEENHEANAVKMPLEAWIGLYRVPWTWSDKSTSLFRNWDVGEPNNFFFVEHCVGEGHLHKWHDNNCNDKRAFICHEDEIKDMTVVRMKFQTDADMTDPAINTQILQQLRAVITSQEPADIELRWTIEPRKQETRKKLTTVTNCISRV